MKLQDALLAGTAGAVVLNLLHEAARRVVPDAPRVDLVGRRALVRGLDAAGAVPPDERTLYGATLAGDVVSNALYYGLVGLGPRTGRRRRGLLLGLAAGVGAAVLPPHLGLGEAAVRRSPATAAMTVAWYTAGGLAAAVAADALECRREAPRGDGADG